MKSNDLGGWISGLLVLIGLAYSLGQGKALHDFALRQAAQALVVRPSERFFTTGSTLKRQSQKPSHRGYLHSPKPAKPSGVKSQLVKRPEAVMLGGPYQKN